MALGWMTALFALASAVTSAAGAFLRCEERRDRNLALLGGWIELGDRVQEALMEYDLAHRVNGGPLEAANGRTFGCHRRGRESATFGSTPSALE